MKKGWEYSTIGDLCDKMNGLWKGKVGPFVNVGVIRNANFTKAFTLSFDNIEYLDVEAKQYKTRKLQKGDLIVEKSGGSEKQPVGRTVLFDKEDGEYSFSNFTSVLRIKDRNIITPEFLYKYILFAYLRGDTRKMQKATTGIHNIEFDKFLAIPVPKLTLSEQQTIVDYLDSAFAKIDAMKANAEKALNEAKALFQASLKEMLEPKEGWEKKKLGDIADFVRGPFGGSLTKSMFKSSGYAVYEQQHAIHQHINIRYFIDDAKFKEMERFSVKAGDVIMSCSGVTLGKINILPQDSPAGIINQALLKMTVKASTNVRFFKYWLESNYFQTIIKKYSGGAAIPNVPAVKILKDFVISIPSPPEQQSIVAKLDSLKSKVDRLQANYEKISQECDALKQAILRQVFE